MNNDLEQFSEKELTKWAKSPDLFHHPDWYPSPWEVAALARIALAAKQAKPTFEEWLSSRTEVIEVDCGCVTTEAFYHWLKVAYEATPQPAHTEVDSPEIPDGWKLVPIEPTEDMIVNGFESEPDETFSDDEAWEAYDAMSGCEQAAHRAKLCWQAMLSAAPKPESE